MDAVQCPRCELRFPNRVELVDHLNEAHPDAVRPPDDPRDRRPRDGGG